MTALTIALSKGRIFDETLPLLAALGMDPAGDIDRLLRVPSRNKDVSLLIVRASDVPTYVEYGAADLGVVGKDVLMEHGGSALYEPLDLGIAQCRLSVAAKKDGPRPDGVRRLRVATKYPEITRRHFAAKGEQVEIIKLYGSMELAPLVGLADLIVDLVATGSTLKANGLVEIETICQVTSRLVVNKAAMKMKNAAIQTLIAQIAERVQAGKTRPGKGK
ncbi:ATP phosphoribosyltransferase [Sinimarinibacterium sp. CAU 1509]|uniref:ATP phosphoribosyltransferase n=1 Tax=Sinimarinibacterium sp. CAU 1509 TaxID=2562283 RepID=UPI0010ABEB77|nr:ATP phosphoribosyltransferase [Sinimarinibacterium sp. CAU 1509]TJY65149.1 ATP phosphoribosyltransferase [Sinimarinibacterium sp. CAU 1509]